MAQSKKSSRGAAILLLLLLGLGSALFLSRRKKTSSQTRLPEDSLIINRLTNAGIDPATARMWAAVSRHETGVYKSELLKRANNLFGMKQPKKRETTSIGATSNGYASYNTQGDSVSDLILYQREFGYPTRFRSVADLVAFMKSKGYFEDTLRVYRKAVESHFENISPEQKRHGASGTW